MGLPSSVEFGTVNGSRAMPKPAALISLESFLRYRDTNLPSVLSTVSASVGLNSDEDVLLAVGSIVEHLGSNKSDLDLLLITSRSEKSLPQGDSFALVVGRCLVDVRVVRSVELESLLSRLDAWSCLPWDVAHAAHFSLVDRTLLHRLRHGYALFNAHRNLFAEQRPLTKSLARLKLHAARQVSRTIQVDMVGYRESRDYCSLGFAAQELLGHAVDALCSGYQLTNPLPKWRSRILSSLPSDWELALTVRPTGLSVVERVWRLHRAPAKPGEGASLEHAFHIVTFARAVFFWAEGRLRSEACSHKALKVWPPRKERFIGPALPYLDFDVDFLLGKGRVRLARLNEFSEPLDMSQDEFSLALLFDGVTTASEAGIVVFGTSKQNVGRRVTNRLLAKLARTGLSISPANQIGTM